METRLSDLYQDYKRRLDVRRVLEAYNAQNVSEVVSADGTTELVHSCLLDRIQPHHAHNDAHPSAWANIEKGLYCCAVYWAGDIFHLIMLLEGKETFDGIVPVISDFLTGATKDEVSFRQEIESFFAQPVYSVDLPSYSERVLDPWRVSHPLMRDIRGVSQETHKLLGIGYDERENRIVFPHFWDSRLVGWQKRVIEERPGEWPGTCPPWPKYKNSSGFPRAETIYAYDLAKDHKAKRVVVVESAMSVARAYSMGITDVIATFGCKATETQIDLLKDFDQVVVWYDDDVAGRMGADKLVSSLYRYTDVLYVDPDEGMDLADYATREEVDSKIEDAAPAALVLGRWDSAN
jgi:5S rRNA maturation endonuclease (ribonuclease M5)